MSATSYRILAVHGDMFSCLSSDCPRLKDCWRAQKPHHSLWQSYATPEPNGCEDFIAIKHIGQPCRMMDNLTFTDDDIAIGRDLGPEYRASQRFAEGVMKDFREEHLEPIIKMIADQVQDKLWATARDWLLQDTETNVHGAVRYMVEQTIEALLTGEEWAMQRYPYADYTKGEEIRKAVAKHGSDTLLMARIADLEAELAKAKETINRRRR